MLVREAMERFERGFLASILSPFRRFFCARQTQSKPRFQPALSAISGEKSPVTFGNSGEL